MKQYLFAVFLILIWIGLAIYFDQTGNKALSKEVLEGGFTMLVFAFVFGGIKFVVE